MIEKENKYSKEIKGYLICILASSVIQIFMLLFVILYTQHTQLFFIISASANTFVGLKTAQMLYFYLKESKKNKEKFDLPEEK